MRTTALVVLSLLALPAPAQNLADRHYDPARMAAAREQLRREVGGQTLFGAQVERLEYRGGEGDAHWLWDAEGGFGGDIHRLKIETEGEYASAADTVEEAELQALYSRAISRYFDLQIGWRTDLEPGPRRHFAVFSVEGMAPYWTEIEASAFVGNDGDLSARVELEYELFLTQRLVLAPRLELEAGARAARRHELGAGLRSLDAGLRLRYEVRRQFAPYLGVSWHRALGDTADRVRDTGGEAGTLSWLAGVRLWF